MLCLYFTDTIASVTFPVSVESKDVTVFEKKNSVVLFFNCTVIYWTNRDLADRKRKAFHYCLFFFIFLLDVHTFFFLFTSVVLAEIMLPKTLRLTYACRLVYSRARLYQSYLIQERVGMVETLG